MKSYQKDYPRPQLVRKDWVNMNGGWDFSFDDANCGEKEGWYRSFPQNCRTIQVPFTYETKCSGINEQEIHDHIWYHQVLTLAEEAIAGKRVILHFEGSDFRTTLWVNGEAVGSHRGGYARFSFDITRYVKAGENQITVKVDDSVSIEQPRGKQRWLKDNYACWYVQTTGIWKTVWAESIPETYLADLKMTPDIEDGTLAIEYQIAAEKLEEDLSIETIVSFGDQFITASEKKITQHRMSEQISVAQTEPNGWAWGIHLWSPEAPELYDLEIRIKKNGEVIDRILSYFGMREIRIENGLILLNGRPIYQRLILDQGYWEDSHLTPPSEEALITDIDRLKEMGYNGVRKHMKIEDTRFLYWSDVKGFLVWSEMAAAYAFNDNAVQEFTREWMEIVRQQYNHPSIITWTPFNESWGIPRVETSKKQQAFTEAIYYLTKSFDFMRPVVVNDGWEHTISDIITLHDYEEKGEVFLERYAKHFEELMSTQVYHCRSKSAFANGYGYKGQPIIISEFGGIAYASDTEGAWGYGNMVKTEEEFLARFDSITSAIKALPYCCGFCYTQVSDVQQEINGLLDARHEYKMPPEKIREINMRGNWIYE